MAARRIKVWRAPTILAGDHARLWFVTAPGVADSDVHVPFPSWRAAYVAADGFAEQVRVKARQRDERQRRQAWLHTDFASGVTQGPL